MLDVEYRIRNFIVRYSAVQKHDHNCTPIQQSLFESRRDTRRVTGAVNRIQEGDIEVRIAAGISGKGTISSAAPSFTASFGMP